MNGFRKERAALLVQHAPEVQEGPNFRIRRAIPDRGLPAIGPFILTDHIGPRMLPPGAPVALAPHPHAGMETLTYLIAGATEHRDSTGHHGTIHSGEMQWMRAGRGIVHSEGPGEPLATDGGLLHAIQLWIDLPKGSKHVDPAYATYRTADIPTLAIDDAVVRLLAGRLAGARGPIDTFADPFAAHIRFDGRGSATLAAPEAIALGLYVIGGTIRIGDGPPLELGQIATLWDGDCVRLSADDPADALLFGGPPIAAPIVRHGPFVMNDEAELAQALRDFRTGRMGKIPSDH